MKLQDMNVKLQDITELQISVLRNVWITVRISIKCVTVIATFQKFKLIDITQGTFLSFVGSTYLLQDH